jgi:hypothetical protein
LGTKKQLFRYELIPYLFTLSDVKKMMVLSRNSYKMIKEHIESRGQDVLRLLREKRWLISRKDMDKMGEDEKDIWGVI